jgi:hypothetical protein
MAACWTPEAGLMYCTPAPRYLARHARPPRWRRAARALAAGAARAAAAPVWLPRLAYTRLEAHFG